VLANCTFRDPDSSDLAIRRSQGALPSPSDW
jgi:hypothetical protein